MREFSSQVIQELETLKIPDYSNREPVLGFTIDAETSLDLDDAIWIEPTRRGAIVMVHITDVTAIIPQGSALEAAAIERVETHYHTRTVDPMLPADLANNKLSLLEGQLRPTVTIQITLNHNAEIEDTRVSLTQLTSLKKFSYVEAESVMNQPSDPFFSMIRYCDIWSQKLYWRRTTMGAIGGTSISGLFLDEEGKPDQLRQYRSQQIIQEFMILANTAIAQLAAQHQLPILYRNHTASAIAPEKKIMIETLSALGMPDLIRSQLATWLNKATYNPYLVGHFALSIDAYCHFTSPIRRVADLLNHRMIKAVFIEHQAIPYTVEKLTKIADAINQYKEEYRQKNNEFFEAERAKRAQAILKIPSQLQHLGEKEFSQILKNAVGTEKIVTVIPEIINRLQNKSIQPLDLYYLSKCDYSQPETQNLAEALIAYYQQAATRATQILQIKSQRDSTVVDYIYQQNASHHFACWCIVDNQTSLYPAKGQNKQESKHYASILWWEQFFKQALVAPNDRVLEWEQNPEDLSEEEQDCNDVNPIETDEFNDSVLSSQPDEQTELLTQVDNPIGYLNDKLPIMGIDKPQYEYRSLPQGWECTCKVIYQEETITGVQIASSKKEAKHSAALITLNKLEQKQVFSFES
ncbi:ribonuclease II [Gloeothece citriformis PCC 7424]|uniref:Ribonuclease II n=1 Tax=Gloeothece citriformis (strain PCC 7424) TaxID=65393 RepID=B7KBJ4_GLOC7|nr:RNB domain-containing ribonuclease [Gloeothece citriformis]ACK72972.1 ribonuclease II [Gloeothece citriformis PCC 7424]